MADEAGQRPAGVEGVAAVAALAHLHLLEGGADLAVLAAQVVDLPAEEQPLEGNGAALGPFAGERAALFLGDQFELAVAILDQPAQAGGLFRLPHPPGHLDEFLQALLPGRVRGDDVGQETAVEPVGEVTGGLPHGGLALVQGGEQFGRLHGHPEKVVAHRLVVQVAQDVLEVPRDVDPHPVERHDRHQRGEAALVGHQAFGERQHVRHDLIRRAEHGVEEAEGQLLRAAVATVQDGGHRLANPVPVSLAVPGEEREQAEQAGDAEKEARLAAGVALQLGQVLVVEVQGLIGVAAKEGHGAGEPGSGERFGEPLEQGTQGGQPALQQVTAGQQPVKGHLLVLGHGHGPGVFQVDDDLRVEQQPFQRVTDHLVEQEKLERARQAAEPDRIKGAGGHQYGRRVGVQVGTAAALEEGEGLVEPVEVLGVHADAELTQGPPAAGHPLAVHVVHRRPLFDQGGEAAETAVGHGLPGELLGQHGRTLVLAVEQPLAPEPGNHLAHISLAEAAVGHRRRIEGGQALGEKGGGNRLVDDGDELQEELLTGRQGGHGLQIDAVPGVLRGAPGRRGGRGHAHHRGRRAGRPRPAVDVAPAAWPRPDPGRCSPAGTGTERTIT